MFESTKINPVVKKMFDAAFKKTRRSTKKKTICELFTAAITRVARMCAADAGRAVALGVSEDVARRTNAGADAKSLQTGLNPQIVARSCVLIVTALNTALMI